MHREVELTERVHPSWLEPLPLNGLGAVLSHAEKKPGRVRIYAYRAMLMERGEVGPVWRAAVAAAWRSAFPNQPLPAVLDVDAADDVAQIIELVRHLCPRKGITGFDPSALRSVLARVGAQSLFPTRDFFALNLTTTAGKYLSVRCGLLAILAEAVGVEHYTTMANRQNVLYYYNL
jgi:hypothetical protein